MLADSRGPENVDQLVRQLLTDAVPSLSAERRQRLVAAALARTRRRVWHWRTAALLTATAAAAAGVVAMLLPHGTDTVESLGTAVPGGELLAIGEIARVRGTLRLEHPRVEKSAVGPGALVINATVLHTARTSLAELMLDRRFRLFVEADSDASVQFAETKVRIDLL